jgi:hypothetical protein
MSWDVARSLLNQAVPAHLGELVQLTRAAVAWTFPVDFGPPIVAATVRAVLTRPEQLARLGLATLTMSDARMTLRVEDAPAWIARGTVAAVAGATYEVTAVANNGEGLLEVLLCRSS